MVVSAEYITREHSRTDGDPSGGTPGSGEVTGILALQGAFAEHAAMLDRLGAPWRLVRDLDDLDDSIGRLILPGGESTTQGKLLKSTGLMEPIAARIADGMPVFGTCAGMILLASHLDNDPNVYFAALDATVRRNAYGRQLGSFATTATLTLGDDSRIADFPVVFIRGPFVAQVGSEAHVVAEVDGNVVALRQGNVLATAFHPELTEDTRLHEYFLSL
ncbi:pyridoxal 5'-phosphate synthase glutaminase subunit PdxT [Bifidobacterium choloepi]|uniref:Pyridoxal 5'-phosphate synthase subunit PdxT n=1 Tax=Bifidobacterium choloepi TaxID=2614131 RepID=A0A6I5N9K7_9BIFI|nr:pyridoxal 5'-phosphate synthase glutaminase subunit PdxT [Bifidobacterium choloepi]NEG69190.1 pyridoxal 5'-phosphate synthase glutaminase subunit PdxT [Bifidobacterium choloepi]